MSPVRVWGERMRPEPREQPVGSFTLGGDPCWSAVFACSVLLWIHEERPSPLPMHHSSWIFRQRLQLLHLINQGLKAHFFHTEKQGVINKQTNKRQNYDKDGRKTPQGGKNAYNVRLSLNIPYCALKVNPPPKKNILINKWLLINCDK